MDDDQENDVEIYFVPPEQDEDQESTEEENSNNSNDSNANSLDLIQIDDDQTNEADDPTDEADEHTNEADQRRILYNRSLPSTHSYLGNDFEELNGRVILEEESIVTLPLLFLPGVCVIPGQLLPLQFEGSYFLSTIKNIIDGNKIFGLVSNYNRHVGLQNVYNNVKLNCLGTVVEVRSYGTENNGTTLMIKAEGKERFLIRETWTESNRTVMGKVFILPEENSKHPFYKDIGLSSQGCRHNKKLLSACTPYPSFAYDLYDPEYLMDKIRSHLNQWASFSTNTKSSGAQSSTNVYENRTVSQTTGTNQPNLGESNRQEQRNSQSSTNQISTSNPSTTDSSINSSSIAPQPVSVVSTRTIVTKIVPVRDSESEEEDEETSEEEHGFKAYAPSNPMEFSYWVTANLPLEDHQRLILLSLNHPVQRLRWQSNFFEKYLSLSCVGCNSHIFSMCDIFSMSVKGSTCYYQDVFINSGGISHDNLTVKEVKNIYLIGKKSSEYSWYPNYSWIIIGCSSCDHHIGWKFVADNKRLKPQYFFGISRRNVKPSIDKDNPSEENPTI